jgi:hypothetical protein
MNSAKKFSMAATLVGLGAVSSLAEIKVNDNLSLSGFFDMSTTYNTETEVGTMSFDQFEVDFMYKFDKLTARADVNSLAGGDMAFEQAFVSYAIGSGATNLTLGRFLSVSGFEAAEPTGLYQFSVNKALRYGGYQTGASLGYNGGTFGIYGAFVTNPWAGGDVDVTLPGFEAQIALMPTSAITVKATAVVDISEDSTDEKTNKQLYNAWAQFASGAITAAGEFSYLIDYDETEGMGYMAMVNYKIGSNYAVTLRHSGWIPDGGDLGSEVTFSPSVILTPNWSALAEVRVDFDKDAADETVTTTTLAAETIFTF